MIQCPRCQADDKSCRIEQKGFNHAGEQVWTIYHCTRCSFTWRDTEPASSIDYDQREAFFRVDPEKKYPFNIPPAKRKE